MKFVWIPEAPNYHGVYAVEPKDGTTCTRNASEALQFETREACQAWCNVNPSPAFEPQEHAFG